MNKPIAYSPATRHAMGAINGQIKQWQDFAEQWNTTGATMVVAYTMVVGLANALAELAESHYQRADTERYQALAAEYDMKAVRVQVAA